MNQEKINMLNPVELDEKIAEYHGYTDIKYEGQFGLRGNSPTAKTYRTYIPNYSGQRIEALNLVEEMQPFFFSIMIIFWDHTDNIAVQCNPRKGHDEYPNTITGEGITLSIAICRAYLIWKNYNQVAERSYRSQSMLYINGSKEAYKCSCGCNVFTRVRNFEYTCNGCGEKYSGEKQ